MLGMLGMFCLLGLLGLLGLLKHGKDLEGKGHSLGGLFFTQETHLDRVIRN